MRRLTLAVVILLLVTSLCYSQGARPADYTAEGKTDFTAIGIHGYNNSGNPGYIELKSTTHYGSSTYDNTGTNNWYLWVDTEGDLCMASYVTISAYASFPTGDWTSGMPCSKVGSQS